jgi:hypothetical protein
MVANHLSPKCCNPSNRQPIQPVQPANRHNIATSSFQFLRLAQFILLLPSLLLVLIVLFLADPPLLLVLALLLIIRTLARRLGSGLHKLLGLGFTLGVAGRILR